MNIVVFAKVYGGMRSIASMSYFVLRIMLASCSSRFMIYYQALLRPMQPSINTMNQKAKLMTQSDINYKANSVTEFDMN